MGSKLRTLSGDDLIRIFSSFGFSVFSQRGSHIKLRRDSAVGKEIIVFANHKSVPRGTLKAIFNQASRFVPQSELHQHFYTD
jgi:predicted RNA binding protein YcfA (HicA-like mRNA interferase family)